MATPAFISKIITDTGISMGDEGKGRLIYELIDELQESTGTQDPVSIVLKVNGGANSGHTAGGLKLNLLPAGVVAKTVPYLAIGSGVVADPRKFLWEAAPLEARGYSILDRLIIDERTMMSDVTHRLLDLAIEYYRANILGEEPRGSTGRGISPSYADETSQWQIYYASFKGPKEVFAKALRQKAERAEKIIQYVCELDEAAWDDMFDTLTQAELRANKDSIDAGTFSEDEFDFYKFKGAAPFKINVDKLIEVYWETGQKLAKGIDDVRELCQKALRDGKYILGEFGQSFWLDKRHGFSPNVTASHTFTPEIFQSAGLPVQPVHNMGVCKAYDTKVGTHLFLTQFEDGNPLGEFLKKLEFGTSTGRQRMVGWFDAVEKGDALRYGGFQDLVINKLDALTRNDSWQGNLQLCVAYEDAEGKRYHHVPRNDALRATLKPVYVECEGWDEDISKVRSFADLPKAAKTYVARMVRATLDVAYEGVGYPEALPNLRYIGVGPDPEQIIKDVPETRDLILLA